MKAPYFAVVALALCSANVSAQTLEQVAASTPRCISTPIAGLSNQIFETFQCHYPGLLVPIEPGHGVVPSGGVYAPIRMYLRPDARARLYQLGAGGTITVNDTFRTVADQHLFHLMGQLQPGGGDCMGGPRSGGRGRHETGVAIDVNGGGALSDRSGGLCCRPLPSDDPVHFECRPGCGVGNEPTDPNDVQVRVLGVQAFQFLWNANHPNDQILADGNFGPATEARLRASPAGGFPVSGCEPDRDADGYPESRDCNDREASIHPGATELCNNIDDDCDRSIDEAVTRGCGAQIGACRQGIESCQLGRWSECVGSVEPGPEVCDGIDNDCDGTTDQAQVCEFEAASLQLSDSRSSVAHSDIDGDGRADVCALTDRGIQCALSSARGFDRTVSGPVLTVSPVGAPGSALSVASSLRMADVDGDHHADVCAISQADARSLECWKLSATAPPQSLGSIRTDSPLTNVLVAELDGDGVSAELCVRSGEGLTCYRYAPSGFAAVHRLPALSDVGGFAQPERYGSIRIGDLDGDRRSDICARVAEGMLCWRSTATEFLPSDVGPQWSDERGFSQVALWSTLRMTDIDGDGRAELCARQPEQSYVCHSWSNRQFSGALQGPSFLSENGWNEPSTYRTLMLGDMDGDGGADLCARETQGLRCWLWTGRSFGRLVLGPTAFQEPQWLRAESFTSLRLTDVSGDGRTDLCLRHADGLQCYLSNGADFSQWLRTSLWSDATSQNRLQLSSSMQSAGRFVAPRTVGGCACTVIGTPSRTKYSFNTVLIGLLVSLVHSRRRQTRKQSSQ